MLGLRKLSTAQLANRKSAHGYYTRNHFVGCGEFIRASCRFHRDRRTVPLGEEQRRVRFPVVQCCQAGKLSLADHNECRVRSILAVGRALLLADSMKAFLFVANLWRTIQTFSAGK